jgi:ribosomal protein L37AE/L43A
MLKTINIYKNIHKKDDVLRFMSSICMEKLKNLKFCTNCKTTKTAQWRKGKNGVWLCNRCGLRYKKQLIKNMLKKN